MDTIIDGGRRKRLGASGESLALAHIARHGYHVVATNYRLPHRMHAGEIDIVALDGNILCFIEVKTRRSQTADPTEAVGPAKRRQLIALAEAYLAQNACDDNLACRFDVIAVALPPACQGEPSVTVFKNAFWPE
ncbi:MAG: YraN family protein [Capsulimonadaceae bacterium]|nr:YraN family protein [Capsulimonadaceae bacterium]